MKILRAAAMLALLTGPAFAQVPNVNLIPELPSKTPEERERDRATEKAYRESLRKIPDAKTGADPWGAVRSSESSPKAAPVKPKAKTGTAANASTTR